MFCQLARFFLDMETKILTTPPHLEDTKGAGCRTLAGCRPGKKNSGKRKKQKGKSSWQEVQDTLKEVNTVTVKSYLLSYAASK